MPRKTSDEPVQTRRDPLVLAAIGGTIAQLGFLWGTSIPLGVPGEWEWSRIKYTLADVGALVLGLLWVIPVSFAYIWLCRSGDVALRQEQARSWPRLTALWLLGFAWLCVAQEAAPQDWHRLGRAPLVLYFGGSSGYFEEAREIDDLPAFLSRYEQRMSEGDVLHIGTHPPGLITIHRILLDIFERHKSATSLMLATRPRSVVETEEAIAAVAAAGGRPLSQPELAELWAATVLVQLAAAAAAIPLFWFAAQYSSREVGWRVACLWPAVPALAVFLPKADAFLPLIGMTVLALWNGPQPPRPMRAALAGAVFWLGMNVSLAMLPVGLLAGLLTLHSIAAEESSGRRPAITRLAGAIVSAGATFLCLTAVTWALTGANLISIWTWNYRNHAAFYDAYTRTYWKWLLVNPLELALAVGLPVTIAAVTRLRRPSELWSPAGAMLAVILLLWLSGKNSGEAARLWLIVMPWVLLASAPVWSGDTGQLRWRTVLPLQLAVAFATAVRLSGFGFDELLGRAV